LARLIELGFLARVVLLALGMFVGMLLLQVLGWRLGKRRLERDPEARTGLAAADGAVFALMGLMVAFSFAGAAQRFDDRRDLIVAESNAIGTAWLRIDLLPAAGQAPMRDGFRRYLDARLAVYAALPDRSAAWAQLAKVRGLEGELWSTAVAAAGASEPTARLLIPPLNEMFDTASKRTAAMLKHPPFVLFALLVGLGLACALLAGFSMASAARRPTLHMVVFAGVVALTVYIILDLEFPRAGLIRIDANDRVLFELRDSMR
jgi:hypothetical protein